MPHCSFSHLRQVCDAQSVKATCLRTYACLYVIATEILSHMSIPESIIIEYEFKCLHETGNSTCDIQTKRAEGGGIWIESWKETGAKVGETVAPAGTHLLAGAAERGSHRLKLNPRPAHAFLENFPPEKLPS